MIDNTKENWTEIIQPKTQIWDLRLKDLWRYRDLVMMFVRRDYVTYYKQTILGPLWFILQPLLTTLVFFLIFGKAANLAPAGTPPIIFYLSGIIIWNYFSECLTKTATVFRDNAAMLSKIYFPRLVLPFSIVLSNLIRFIIQFFIFCIIWLYYFGNKDVHPNIYLLLTPFLVLLMGLLALGAGMIISALTTKYRDLIFLMNFGVQLLMFLTPIMIPLEKVPFQYQWIIRANPATPIIETFRYAFTGYGSMNWGNLVYSGMFTVFILILGIIIFNKTEKSFTDVI